MKKLFFPALILTAACVMLAGCGGDDNNAAFEEQFKDNGNMVYDKYDLKTYLYPLWRGNTTYNETLWFAGDKSAPLMYTPDEVLKVTSYDLKTIYEEGVDYTVEGKSIKLTEGSRIPYLAPEEFSERTEQVPANMGGLYYKKTDGYFCYAAEGALISSKQVAVTYTHSDTVEWTKPTKQTDKFPKTMEKLEKGEALKVVFYGDSITVGANASSHVGYGPYAEDYTHMVKSYMAKRYPNATVDYVNNAVGGTNSTWGAMKNELQTRVLDENPDILFVAFGMNDPDSRVNYEYNLKTIIDGARKNNPDIEIMLISSMTANPETNANQKDFAAFEQILVDLSEKYERVGVATVYSSVASVYNSGKRFQDCTGNNINHPNDFISRVYAQTIVCSLFGEDYIFHI